MLPRPHEGSFAGRPPTLTQLEGLDLSHLRVEKPAARSGGEIVDVQLSAVFSGAFSATN